MDNLEENKKPFSVRARILMISLLPCIIVGIAISIFGISFMKSSMEDEVLKGLLSSAYAYRDTGITNMTREAGDNLIENTLKNETGYDFTWFDGDTRKNSSLGSNVIGTKAAKEVIKQVIYNKQVFTSTNTEVAGKAYFVAYVPIRDEKGKVISMAFSGVPRESVENQIWKTVEIIIVIVVILLGITVLIALRASTRMSRAVKAIEESVTDLSNGDFVKNDKYVKRSDEIGHTLRSTNSLIDRLILVIRNIQNASKVVEVQSMDLTYTSNQISSTTENVSEAIEEMAKGSNEQAITIKDANLNIAELSKSIQNVADNAEQLAKTASNMNESSKASAKALSNLSNNMIEMEKSIESIEQTMNDTNLAVNNVKVKVEGITSIASQTNLLSLNASIEAARAGESGRGFSIVAEEIGKLATESATTAEEIKQEMQNLLTQSTSALEKTYKISQIKEIVNDVLKETVKTINNLIANVAETVGSVNDISILAEKCDTSKSVIVDAMKSLSKISAKNTSTSQKTSESMLELSKTINSLSKSAEDLHKITEELDSEIKFFNI